jgi:adenylyl cyclase-associated protein
MPSAGGSTRSAPVAAGTADMSGVFSELSKGESVTAGLRKVDPSQQTHKNPSLRASSTVPQRSDSLNSSSSSSNLRGKSPAPSKRPKPESMRTKKPPRKELEGTKWLIENFDSPTDGPIEIEAKTNHSVLITRCTNTTIIIKNKANAISIDSSARIALVVDSLVSSIDAIKTPKLELQVLGTVPTILLDQVDGAQIYLGRDSLGTEVFSSKCTGVNVNVPGAAEEEEDYRECAVPEQIKTVIRGGVAVSEIVEHAG